MGVLIYNMHHPVSDKHIPQYHPRRVDKQLVAVPSDGQVGALERRQDDLVLG